jgi:hypothetical protein
LDVPDEAVRFLVNRHPEQRMGIPARNPSSLEPDPAPAEDSDPEQFRRAFRRRMAEQGIIVRMASPQPDWEPAITLDVPADELSATVVSLRRGEL